MVFINSFDEKVILAIYLQNLHFTYIKSNRKRLIKTFTLILEPDIKAKYLEDFSNGDTKI